LKRGDSHSDAGKASGVIQRGKRFSQRGVALIAVVGALSMTAIVTAEFSMDATVDYEAAVNVRDNMRADILARSGMNLSRLVIKVQTSVLDRYRQYIGDIQLADYVPMFMGVFSGSKEEVAAIGEAVGLAGDAVSGLGLPEGTFDLAISTDDGKINVNCANTNNVAEQAILQTKLQALVYSDAYEQLFQNESADGWRRSRDEQVAAIIDYVDRDTNRYTGPDASGRAPEDYGYQQNDDRYLAKNNYIDTVDELKLVRGIDDRFWTLFGSAFTVYGDCKQNIGAVQDVNVILAIIVAAAKDGDPVAQDINRVWLLAQFVAKARQMGFLFDDLNSFADFVKDPGAMFGAVAEGDGANVAATALGAGLDLSAFGVNQIPEGVELDTNKLQQVAIARERRTYRVESTATMGRVTKRIIGVWDKEPVRQNRRPRDTDTKGTWVFWKEE